MALSPTSSGKGASGSGTGAAPLFDQTLGAPAVSIDTGAGGVAQTATCIDIYIYARTAEAVIASAIGIRFNNDATAIYDRERLTATNITAAAAPNNGATQLDGDVPGANATASVFGTCIISVPNYTGTVGFKTCMIQSCTPNTLAASSTVDLFGGGYRSLAAISRVAVFVVAGSNLATGTRMVILGR